MTIAAVENRTAALVLGAMTILPLADVAARATIHTSVAGSAVIVQHLALVLGMLGGAIAAREGRLLALSTLGDRERSGSVSAAARTFATAVSVAASTWLAAASYWFVKAERHFSHTVVYGTPIWVVELVLPVGFVAIGGRLLLRSAETGRARVVTAAVALLLVGAGTFVPDASTRLFLPACAALVLAVLFGAPAFVALGGAALMLFWRMQEPIASIAVSHYALSVNPSIPTLPLFTLAGYLLAESGAPRRLVRVFAALVGRVRGGPAVVTVLVCTFFTSFTGGSGITILALGGLLMPVLLQARYSPKDALGLVTGSGSLGMLLPPCLPLIVYAIVARIPINAMFLGGVVPALFMAAVTAWWGVRRAPAAGDQRRRFDAQEALSAVADAKWELLTPVVTAAALFSGAATAVQSAAVTALYVLIVETIVHRDLHILRDVPRVMSECALLVGGILLILGVALGFMNYLVVAEVPARAVAWTTGAIHSKLLFLLLLNVFLIVVGCLMDIFSAIIVQVPLLVPLGAAYGVDPIQLGVIFLANMELGYLTPPVGLNLYMAAYRFQKPVPMVLLAVLPIVLVLHVGVLLITYVPALTTTLPRWFGY